MCKIVFPIIYGVTTAVGGVNFTDWYFWPGLIATVLIAVWADE